MGEETKRDDVSEYDAEHGDPAKGRDHKDAGLTEGANRPPPAPEPYRNLKSE
jgi:hypothetical protein